MVEWNVALGVKPIDIDVGKTLKTVADIESSRAYTVNTLAESQKKMYDLSREEMGRAAKHLLMMPEGPERDKLYQGYMDDFTKKRYMQPHEAEYWRSQKPTNMMLQQVVANSVPVGQHAQITGEAAGNEARQRFPYNVQHAQPTDTPYFPSQSPGAPPTTPTISGKPVQAGGVSGGITPSPTVPTAATPPTGVQRQTTPLQAAAERSRDPIYNEVPKIEPPAKPALGQGVIRQGRDPADIEADHQAAKVVREKIHNPASAASEQRANYKTLRTALESGINTSKAGPALATISGWMNAAGMDPKIIKEWTGTDPTQADVLHKATIQESMKFVKDTIGARESLMAIQAITSAFPHLANTKEGNLIMVDIMDELAKYTQDRAKYAGAFMEKNQELGWNNNLNAFARWWAENKPAEQYVSRAMPRNLPAELSDKTLQNGVTYVIPTGVEKSGKPTYGRGKWNSKTMSFDPVQ